MSATTSTTTSGLSLSGLASGLNWTSIINDMLTEAAAPEQQMQTEETTDQNKKTAYTTIGTDLTTLGSDLTTLGDPSFFASRTASVSNSLVASATAASGTPLGTYSLTVNHLATDSVQIGATASAPLNSSNDVSGLVLSSAGFSTAVTAGTITVNGQSITIDTSDTLGSVLSQIATAIGGTATYNSTADEIDLSSSSPISLGSDTDTSNFLQVAELYNNDSGSVHSASALGGVNLNDSLSSANLSQPITTGTGGAFMINGVTINFTSNESVENVLQSINSSSAGVTATYDSLNNRFELTDTSTGNVSIAMQDLNGSNFLAASGLLGGTLQAGSNLLYSINNGGVLNSQSNTIDGSAAGIAGLSITALGEGTTTITVATDTQTISSAISKFVTDYNAVQNYISSQTTPTTSSSGTVTPGLLTGDMDSENISFQLRQLVDASPGATPGVESLNDLGVQSNGTDNTLSFSDSTALDSALTNNLSAVESLFTDPSTGIATTVNNYINNINGPNGALSTDETNMGHEVTSLSDSISNLQSQISNEQTELTNEFTAMETAINSINTEKEYLNAYFNSSASSESAPTPAGSSTSSSSSSTSSGL